MQKIDTMIPTLRIATETWVSILVYFKPNFGPDGKRNNATDCSNITNICLKLMDATLRQIWKTMATRPDQLVGAKNVPMWKPAVMAISIIHCVARLIDP